MIALIIIAWIIIAILMSGIMIHKLPDEYGDGDEWVLVFVNLCAWPVLTVIYVGYFIIVRLTKLAVFVIGFLDSLTGNKKKKKKKTRCKDCKYCRGDIFDRGYWCERTKADIDENDWCLNGVRRET